MNPDINYLDGEIPPELEEPALHELCAYLVAIGKYKNEDKALKDAAERVAFLEKADVYADDPNMAPASAELKSIHALIAAHHLHDELSANEGFLPDTGNPAPSASTTTYADASAVRDVSPAAGDGAAENRDTPAGASSPGASVSRTKDPRSLTDVFGSIEFDIRAGLSREQILTRLQDDGLARDNAVEAYAFVHKQRRKKQQTRLLAALTIVVLTVILYFMAR